MQRIAPRLPAPAAARWLRRVALGCAALLPLVALPARPEAMPLTEMDVFGLEWAGSPAVSPDGRTVAYTRNGYDVMTDRPVSRIWLMSADGTAHRPLTDAPGSQPVWSPTGDRIAFLARNGNDVEIFMHWVADNRTAHITQLPEQPSRLSFSPDGRWLAFTMFEPASVEPMVKPPKAPEGAKWAPPFKVYDDQVYRVDGQGYLKPGFTHVYVVPAEGGTPRRVTSGDFNHGAYSWIPDGSALIVSANRRPDWQREPQDTDLYRVSLADGVYTRLTERYGPDDEPAVSPDGRYLAWTGYDDTLRGYENAQLYVRSLVGSEADDLDAGDSLTATLDRSVGNPVWSEDSRAVYVTYEDEGRGVIGRVDRGGRMKVLASDLGGMAISRPYTGGAFHAARGTVAYTRSRADRPAELAVVRSGDPKTLTDLNGELLGERKLGAVRTVRFPSSLDGLEIEAWIATPPDYEAGRTYPLILEIHGGPFAAYGPHFGAEIQLYAAAGYVVMYVNPRGSTSYGAAFANQIHHAYPGGDFDDLMSAVDFAVEEGYADEERLYVTGGSGGGILTAWIVTHTDRFRAAVSAKPVINWYSFVLTADMTNYFQRYWFARPPWEDAQSYLARSPLQFVGNVTTPTMLVTGEADLRTPSSEAEQFYEALKIRGVDTALVRVPEASHDIAARPSHLISKVAHVLAWFERYGGD